jgi:hypothetical protein
MTPSLAVRTEKVAHLLGMSLDRVHDYLSWPADGLDPYREREGAVTLAASADITKSGTLISPA